MAGILDRKVALVTGGASASDGRLRLPMHARARAWQWPTVPRRTRLERRPDQRGRRPGHCDRRFDVSVEADVAAMVARTVAAYGRIDCAFNNAGVAGGSVGPGRSVCTNSARPRSTRCWPSISGACSVPEARDRAHAGTRRRRAIVNTASIAGLIGLATSSHYVAAKHGVVGLTKSAAIEYAPDGIRVNCVNPGYVTTPMTEEVVKTRSMR